MTKQIRAASGYTLLETAIVLVILSVVLLSAGIAYRVYIQEQTADRERLTGLEVQSALGRYVYMKGRYPCPADASLARSEPNYGVEDCRANNAIPKLDGSGNLGTGAECTQPAGGLCNTASAVAADSNIRRGMLPFVTLEIPEDKAYDPYGMRLIYMVSMRQADPTTYKKGGGTIKIRDVASVGAGENSLIDPADKGEFVVFSTGKNRVGAFPRDDVGTPIAADGGKRHITSVPVPCTQGNTGGAGEFANCNNLTEVVYAGSIGTAFIDQATAPAAWNTSSFLDDQVVYFNMTDATFWRQSATNPANIVLRDSLGKVAVGQGVSSASEQLDLGLITSTTPNPEAAIRTSGAVVAENNKFCKDTAPGADCFNPKNIAGDPDLGTGGLKCPPGEIIREIYGDGSNVKTTCVKPNGEFCTLPLRLKGFNANGTPICANPTATGCPARSNLGVCAGGSSLDQIATYINFRLSAGYVDPTTGAVVGPTGARAWRDSSIRGKNPYFSLPATPNGAAPITKTINTVIRKDATTSCNNLRTQGKISRTHLRNLNETNSPYGSNNPFCRYGFNGGQRTETYTCNNGVWIKTTNGDCTIEQCIMAPYSTTIQCNTLTWSNAANYPQVRLESPIGPGSPYYSDLRVNFDSKSAWSGSYTVTGTSCGGTVPTTLPPQYNNCRCTGNVLPIGNMISCDTALNQTGFRVKQDGSVPPGDISADGKSFKQSTSFTCNTTSYGTWSRPTPLASNVCECDPTAQDTELHTCQNGTVAIGSPVPAPNVRLRKTRNCGTTPPSWNYTPEGQCVCTPQIQTPTGTTTVMCNTSYISPDTNVSVFGGMSGHFGQVTITRKSDKNCIPGGPGAPYNAFYSTGVLGNETNITYSANTSGCLPINSTWRSNGGSATPIGNNAGAPSLGSKCIGTAEVAECISRGLSNCPTAAPPGPCYAIISGDTWGRYDACQCGN